MLSFTKNLLGLWEPLKRLVGVITLDSLKTTEYENAYITDMSAKGHERSKEFK
jgi:hypothetical protein